MTQSPYRVRAVACDYAASEDEIYAALKRATAPLTDSWDRLRRARTVGIKFNQDKEHKNRVYHRGHLQQLVDTKVARALLRLLRERTDAELYCLDVSYYAMYGMAPLEETTTFAELLRDFDVPFIDGIQPPYAAVEVPGGGLMFDRYLLPGALPEMDEFVSVALLKNHLFMGVTLSLKNLFGLMPGLSPAPHRTYYHHLVRMPYMLADLGKMVDPVLCVLDGLVGQAGKEWGYNGTHGPAQICNTLVAGNQTIATDACATHLMGHDPQADWLTPPFHRDRNTLLVAAENGFGTVDLQEIDFQSEVEAPVGQFYAEQTDSTATNISWRRTTAEQALFYLDNRAHFVDKFAGQYILLQDKEVRWHDTTSSLSISRRILSGDKPEQAMWFKYVDPDEREGEHYDVYARTLEEVGELEIAHW
ncbi:MAG: DUF362 domain-containing protein [Caldilineaceae bacterium]|nr:DUF362 domain-containing protein [Caldilineaceae bacterium]